MAVSAHSIKVMFYSTHHSSRFPGKWINSTHGSSVLRNWFNSAHNWMTDTWRISKKNLGSGIRDIAGPWNLNQHFVDRSQRSWIMTFNDCSWILWILNLRLKFAAAYLTSFADKLSQDTEDLRPRGLITCAYPELLIACHFSKQHFFAFHFPTESFSLLSLSWVIVKYMG